MIVIRRIKPVWKGKYLMNRIVLADSKAELHTWRLANRRKHKMVFFGSPRKDAKGYYALIQS